jgi:hypothetical protein
LLEACCSRLVARGLLLEASCSRLVARGLLLEDRCSRIVACGSVTRQPECTPKKQDFEHIVRIEVQSRRHRNTQRNIIEHNVPSYKQLAQIFDQRRLHNQPLHLIGNIQRLSLFCCFMVVVQTMALGLTESSPKRYRFVIRFNKASDCGPAFTDFESACALMQVE